MRLKNPDDVQAARYQAIIRRFGFERQFRRELDCYLHDWMSDGEKRSVYLWCVGTFAESVKRQVRADFAGISRVRLPYGKEWVKPCLE